MNRYQVTTKSNKTGSEGMQTYLAQNEKDLNEQIKKSLDFLATKNVIFTVVNIVDCGKIVPGFDRFDVEAKGDESLAEDLRREDWYQ